MTLNKVDPVSRKCPVCELLLATQFELSSIVGVKICGDCDYLIGLGFSNYDEQPKSEMYPATWVYDRIYALSNVGYLEGKKLWLYEFVEYLETLIATGGEAVQEYQRCRNITPEHALQEVRQDIMRVELLLKKESSPSEPLS